MPEPEWLLYHLEEHRLFGGDGATAVLGYTSFPPKTDSSFRVFINEWGAQFGYLLIEDPCSVPFNFFYTSNISLPRGFFLASGGFREDFPAAAWELGWWTARPTVRSPPEDIGSVCRDFRRAPPGAESFPRRRAGEGTRPAESRSAPRPVADGRTRRTSSRSGAEQDVPGFSRRVLFDGIGRRIASVIGGGGL